MEKQLDQLIEKLKAAFGDHIVSVVLYGSAAAGDWQEQASDLNVLCVLKSVSAREIKSAAPIFQWWSKQGHVPPVLLTEREVTQSSDCFPIEFRDIQERRRLLLGRDIIAEVDVDFTYYRALVERELRSKQMRLRQKAIEFLDDRDRLLKLMVDSISTFCALGRHALLLGNYPAKWTKHEILDAMGEVTAAPLRSAKELLKLRENGQKPAANEVGVLLEGYLNDTDLIVAFVDSLDRNENKEMRSK